VEHLLWALVAAGCYYGGYYMGRKRPFRVKFQNHHVEDAIRKLKEIR